MTVTDWHDTLRRATGQTYFNEELACPNDHAVNISVFVGQYPWHSHPDSDETFIVLEGRLILEMEGRGELSLTPGQIYTVPAGAVHRTRGAAERNVNLTIGLRHRQTVFI